MFFLTGNNSPANKKIEKKISPNKYFENSKDENFSEKKKTYKEFKNSLNNFKELKQQESKNLNGFLKSNIKINSNEKKKISNKQPMLSSFFLRKASENNENENQRLNTRDNYINIIKNITSASRENSVFEQSFLKKTSSQLNFLKKKKESLENLDISNIRSTNLNILKVNQSQSPKKIKPIKVEESLSDKKFAIFEKIYSFNTKFVKKLKIEQNKKYTNLHEYQSGMIKIASEKASMENLRSLSQQLNGIREISESAAKIGRTNWKIYGKIVNDCKNSMKSLRNKIFSESEFTNDIQKFQKDLALTCKKKVPITKRFCKYESSLKRISPFIPEYLVEKFKNTLKIIN
jgi:hypothetical protein